LSMTGILTPDSERIESEVGEQMVEREERGRNGTKKGLREKMEEEEERRTGEEKEDSRKDMLADRTSLECEDVLTQSAVRDDALVRLNFAVRTRF
jgi:hypothetical protein